MKYLKESEVLKANKSAFSSTKGLHYIIRLMENPNREMTCLALYHDCNKEYLETEGVSISHEPILMADKKAIESVYGRIKRINSLLISSETDIVNDYKQEKLILEKTQLEDYLREVVNGDHVRYFRSETLRLRRTVWVAITRALEEIKTRFPEIHALLKKELIRDKNVIMLN